MKFPQITRIFVFSNINNLRSTSAHSQIQDSEKFQVGARYALNRNDEEIKFSAGASMGRHPC